MNATLKVKIDTTRLAAAFLAASRSTRSILRKEMGASMTMVAERAQQEHRFTSRSGNLERSAIPEVSASGLQGTVYLDGGLAPYAEFIHEGTGRYGPKRRDFFVAPKVKKALHWGRFYSKGHLIKGWRPDRFLVRAFEKSRDVIRDNLTTAYEKALRKAGL